MLVKADFKTLLIKGFNTRFLLNKRFKAFLLIILKYLIL
jgi:hypothetical protein